MKKLKYLAKEYRNTEHMGHVGIPTETIFSDGFKAAFEIINEELNIEINKLEQYPMMTERIFALKTYIKKMEDILKEAEND